MIIILPKNFKYQYKKEVKNKRDKNTKKKNYIRRKAYEKDGILKVQDGMPFKKMMYQVSLAIYGEQCYYCGKKCNLEDLTMDHLYPQSLGGPSLSNNLVPACHICNEDKGNMNEQQYWYFKSLSTSREKNEYMKGLKEVQEEVKKGFGMDLPKNWIEYVSLKTIMYKQFSNVDLIDAKNSKEFARIKAQYDKYQTIKYPIIVDKNYRLLYGTIMYAFVKVYNIKFIPVVRLENVEVLN